MHDLIKSAFISALISLLAGACLHAAPGDKPNVILIMADDLGYRDLSSYGHPEIKTPALDGVASDGIRLTNFRSGEVSIAVKTFIRYNDGTQAISMSSFKSIGNH